jgi:hypothetical protein
MPPQQGQRLADGIGEFFGFGPHGEFLAMSDARQRARQPLI